MLILISVISFLIGLLAMFETINGQAWTAIMLWALAFICSYCGHLEYMDKHK